jgi:serine/threonine protein phosphatase PrpC
VKLAFMTHRGSVRPENQDALQIAGGVRTGDMALPAVLEMDDLRAPLLLSVVDGLGGHRGGARAAEILVRALAAGADRFGAVLDPQTDARLLRELLAGGARGMREEALRDSALSDMGATIAGLLIRERSALAFNCGDSRAYRFSRGEGEKLEGEKLTHDHSAVQELLDRGEITEEEMRSHPRKNIVTSAVTADAFDDFELFVKPVSRAHGDAFFLCSDGVWEALSMSRLTHFLNDPAPDAPKRFFDSLIAAECRDNVSFIQVR